MNGERETGVTTFLIDQQIDTGNILLQERVYIGERETAGELHDRLMEEGAKLVLRTIRGLSDGSVAARSQEHFMNPGEELKRAPKIFKEDCRIGWDRKGQEVVNFVRGLSPYPGAFTILEQEGKQGQLCKVYEATFLPASHGDEPGLLHSDGKKFLKAAVVDGYLQIGSVQLEGKRRMGTREFLAGNTLTSGRSRFS
jgi:methionyl-tRNA formyltransferase